MDYLMTDMKVIKTAQKYFLWTFWGFLVTILCDVKIDVNICEPHCVNFFFFVNLLHSLGVWFFDIWHIFDNLTSFDILKHYLNHLSSSEAEVKVGSRGTCDMYPLHGVYEPVPHLDLCIIMPMSPLPMCHISPVCHLDLCIIMPICQVTNVPHCPCAPSRSMHYYAHVPHLPCLPSRSMHYYAHMPHHQCAPLSMCPIIPVHHLDLCIIMPRCPIIHVAHYPFALVPITPLCHLDLCIIMPRCPITHVAHYPCPPYPLYPIATVPCTLCTPLTLCPHFPCAPYPCTPLPMCPKPPVLNQGPSSTSHHAQPDTWSNQRKYHSKYPADLLINMNQL